MQQAVGQFGLTCAEHNALGKSEVFQAALVDIVDHDINTVNPIAQNIMQQASRLGMQAWQYVANNPFDFLMHVNVPQLKPLKAVSGVYKTFKCTKAAQPIFTKMQQHFSKMNGGKSSGGGSHQSSSSNSHPGVQSTHRVPGKQSDRKVNITKAESDVWKNFKPFKDKTKTNGLDGKKREYYEWDNTHKDIEVYDHNFKHKGSMNPTTGKMYKPPVEGRDIKQ